MAMPLKSFCTIATLDHMPQVCALHNCLQRWDAGMQLHVFIADAASGRVQASACPPGMRLYCADQLCAGGTAMAILEKYRALCMDTFRWAMKPVFLQYLIEHAHCDRLIYVDNDIHFFNDYAFLFDELARHDIILTPHWRSSDPQTDSTNFFTLYTSGLYNGGFVGVTKQALPALAWWASACLFVCEKNASQGQFVDQTHLNLLPIYFDNVKIIKHRGCNVANWNRVECARVQKDDTVLINGTDPVVFVHFTNSTISGIVKGDDALLAPFLNIYQENLKHYGVRLPLKPSAEPHIAYSAAGKKSAFRAACERLRILQRIRAFLNG